MLNRTTGWLAWVLAAFAVIIVMELPARAQVVVKTEVRDGLLRELIEAQSLDRLQGLWRLSLREPGDALAPLRQSTTTVDVDAAWRKAVDGVFERPDVSRSLAERQVQELSEAEIRQVLAFRRSSLGRKVTEAEVTSPFPQDKLGDTAFIAAELGRAVRALAKDRARRTVLSNILQASGGGAMQAEILMTMSRGFAIGMALASPQGRGQMSIEDVMAFADRDRPKFIALMREIAVPSLALAYRNLTNSELSTYLAQLRSPTGRKNIAAVVKGLAVALNDASIAIGKAFARDVTAQRS